MWFQEFFSVDKKPQHKDSKAEKPQHRDSKTKKPWHPVSVEFWPLCPLILLVAMSCKSKYNPWFFLALISIFSIWLVYLVYLQLTSISEGHFPICNLGTWWMSVIIYNWHENYFWAKVTNFLGTKSHISKLQGLTVPSIIPSYEMPSIHLSVQRFFKKHFMDRWKV